jgi:hypothetical protein
MFVYVTTIKGVNKSSILIGLISKQESSQKQDITADLFRRQDKKKTERGWN